MRQGMTCARRHLSERQVAIGLLLGVFVLFAAAQAFWLAVDRRPVAEERHFLAAARLARAMRGDAAGALYPAAGPAAPYPPLVAWFSAPWMAVFGCTADVAVLTLLPFAALLLWSAWRVGRRFAGPLAAAAGAALLLAFHHFVDVEPRYEAYTFINEYMLDLPQSAFAALFLLCLLRFCEQPRRGAALSLGAVAGLGALIKVSFPLYALIACAAVLAEPGRRPAAAACRRLVPAVLTAALIAAPWYVLHGADVLAYLRHHEFNAALALRDGHPAPGSAAGLLYYLSAARWMLTWPFCILFLGAAAVLAVRRPPGWRLAAAGVVLSAVVLTALCGKSWRFLTPVLIYPALTIVLAVEPLSERRVSAGPRRATVLAAAGIILAAGLHMLSMHGLGAPHRQVAGRPVRVAPSAEDWCIPAVMDRIASRREPGRLLHVSVAPFLRRFRHAALAQEAMERNLPFASGPEWQVRGPGWAPALARSEFILLKSGYNGPSRFVPHRREIAAWLEQRLGGSVVAAGWYPLPDGTRGRLYHNTAAAAQRSLVLPPTNASASGEEAEAVFGGYVALTDWNVRVCADSVEVRCTWRCLRTPEREYRPFVQVREGWLNQAARDYMPGQGLHPVHMWEPGGGLTEVYTLDLPGDGAAPDWTIWIGWRRGWRRWPVAADKRPTLLRALRLGAVRDVVRQGGNG